MMSVSEKRAGYAGESGPAGNGMAVPGAFWPQLAPWQGRRSEFFIDLMFGPAKQLLYQRRCC
jgi:hypothetical protein